MKRVLKIVAVEICLGLILGFIQGVFQIDDNVFMRAYWIIAPAIVIGAILVNVVCNISDQRKISRIATLRDAGKPEEYIAEAEKLLQTVKGKNLRNVLKLNIVAAYMDRKQYDTAIDMLEELSNQGIVNPLGKMIHRLDLCLCYFYSKQFEKAMELYNESQDIFEPYRKDKDYGGNIAVVDIFAAMRNRQYDQAERLLDTARASWNSPRLQKEFQNIDHVLFERKNNSFRKYGHRDL